MVLGWHNEPFRRLLGRKARLPHALLLCGREGIGKLAFAEALARALLCERPEADGAACGRCVACAWLEQGSHPDFRRLEPEALTEQGEGETGNGGKKASLQISVEQVRAIAGFINVSSHRGRAKVVLIHPAEALNLNAANALLKGLEEPPPGTYFLLVAHRWHHLLPTIKSRCQRVVLALPEAGAAQAWLKAQGLRDAGLSLAQAGGAPLLAATFDDEYWALREDFLGAVASPEFEPLRAAERLRECGPALAITWLQKWSFDIAFHKVTGGIRYNPDLSEAIAAAAATLDALQVLRFHREMVRMQRIAAHPLNPRLFLEQLLLDYAELLRNRRSRQPA